MCNFQRTKAFIQNLSFGILTFFNNLMLKLILRDGPSKLNRVLSAIPYHLSYPKMLFLRKEVIQPQVLLRLPCYDFTPIADPTFGRCLAYALAHGLRVLPTLMV